MNAPNLVDIVKLYLGVAQRVGFYWNLYTVGLALVAGWVFSEPTLDWIMATLSTTVFAAFVAINLFGLHASYRFLEAARLEILEHPQSKDFKHMSKAFSGNPYSSRSLVIRYGIHIAIDVLVIACIWLRVKCADTSTDTLVSNLFEFG